MGKATKTAAGCLASIGLLGGAAAALYAYKLRPLMLRWGASDDEAAGSLPGDELLPDAKLRMTHAVTIGAPPEAVWPWLVQIGQGRGGFYSYDWVEAMVDEGTPPAAEILPEFQTLSVGDRIMLDEQGVGIPVAQVEPGRRLVLYVDTETVENLPPTVTIEPDDYMALAWVVTLADGGDGTTRLVSRWMGDWKPGVGHTLLARLVMEPAATLFGRGLLLGLKRRAEDAVSRPALEPAPAT